jgi:rare lipoprotein A
MLLGPGGAAFAVAVLLISGCAGYSKRAMPSGACSGEERMASWYGKDFHGRKTSNGETYDMYGLSAAHRTLPFGTVLRVTECKRGRTVQVRVNDRGPFIDDRELDLSYGAARELGIIADGVASVHIQKVQAPASVASSSVTSPALAARSDDTVATRPSIRSSTAAERITDTFLVQVGAYEVRDNALRVEAHVRQQYPNVYLEPYETHTRQFHRVRVGPFSSEDEALLIANRIASAGFSQEAFHPLVIRAP